MGTIMLVAWVLALLTAAWFGWQAQRSGRSVALWAIAGGLFGLITASFIFGLGHAACIPFSDAQQKRLHLEWALVAILVIGVLGWLFTLGLGRGRAAAPTPGTSPRPPGT